MKQAKQDRRSLRTRRMVNTAMLELLFERSYENITVQDILDRAEIGRSTFYTHYFDKADVLNSIAEQMLEMLSAQLAQRKAGAIVPALELFEHVQQHEQYFRAMLRGHTSALFWEAAQTAIAQSIEQSLRKSHLDNVSPAISWAVIGQCLAGAILALLKWWLETETPYSPAQMERIFERLALPGVREAIGKPTATP
jgi:AcrR family transcriptional regulator